MMPTRRFLNRFALTVMLAVAASACDNKGKEEKSPASATKPAENAEHAHATPAVKPGSHEDWCEEHQVPESLCTRCNPSLIAAFKATNDWCQEHGLPESQCRICSPNLKIERPPRPSSP